MNKLVFHILIICLFSSQLNGLFIYVNFKIDQDFISKVLCINKDKPTSTCNGKCYLSKQLKAQEEKEEKRLPQGKREKTEILFCDDCNLISKITQHQVLEKDIFFSNHLNLKLQDFIDDIFHPPQIG